MRRILPAVLTFVIVFALTGAAYGEEPTCGALAKDKNLTGEAYKSFVAACERVRAERESSAKSPRPGMSPAEQERLDRAMTRNLLQSIEEELRRANPGVK